MKRTRSKKSRDTVPLSREVVTGNKSKVKFKSKSEMMGIRFLRIFENFSVTRSESGSRRAIFFNGSVTLSFNL